MAKAMGEGSQRVAPNGYHYTKVNGKWRLDHHLVAEKKLGRPLRTNERVAFKDGDRNNFDADNIVVNVKGSGSLATRLAVVEARIEELSAERDEILKSLESS